MLSTLQSSSQNVVADEDLLRHQVKKWETFSGLCYVLNQKIVGLVIFT